MGNDPKPLTFIQPEVRAEQFKALRNLTLENIASAIGISPSSFASYLQDNSNRTAREVSAEESSTTLLVENKRASLINAVNELLEDVRRYYGYPDAVRGEFSKAGQTNYTLLVENAVKIRQAGGSSLEQFVRTINPNFDEAQIKRECDLIRKEMEEQRTAQNNSLFGSTDFGDTDIKGGELDEQTAEV
jgi:transcriptional regulator with XRE-family HTH domain